MYIDRLDEIVAAICENVQCTDEPGKVINYAPMAGHALMGEAVAGPIPKSGRIGSWQRMRFLSR